MSAIDVSITRRLLAIAASHFRFVSLTLLVLAGGTSIRQSHAQLGTGDPPGIWWDFLHEHNNYRAMHNYADPGVRWSASLATNAQNWANSCPSDANGNFLHSPRAFIDYGENWAAGYGGYNDTLKSAVASWYNERQNYERLSGNYTVNYPIEDQQFKRDNCGQKCQNTKYGHFTQVVWKATQLIGCGHAKCEKGGEKWDFWVCQYSPMGNIIGQFKNNVGPLLSCWCKCTIFGCKDTCSGAYC